MSAKCQVWRLSQIATEPGAASDLVPVIAGEQPLDITPPNPAEVIVAVVPAHRRDLAIEADVIDAADPSSWQRKLKPNTRAIYTEALTNPLLQVIDHRAVVDFATEHSLVSMIDSTFATPVNMRPLELGVDLVMHSASKYLAGHNDLLAGTVIGPRAILDSIETARGLLGGVGSPPANMRQKNRRVSFSAGRHELKRDLVRHSSRECRCLWL